MKYHAEISLLHDETVLFRCAQLYHIIYLVDVGEI